MATTPITPLKQQAWSKMFVNDLQVDGNLTVNGLPVTGDGEFGTETVTVYSVTDGVSIDLNVAWTRQGNYTSWTLPSWNLPTATSGGFYFIIGQGLTPLPVDLRPNTSTSLLKQFIKCQTDLGFIDCLTQYDIGSGLISIDYDNIGGQPFPPSGAGVSSPGFSINW